jgi:hypothetical protein
LKIRKKQGKHAQDGTDEYCHREDKKSSKDAYFFPFDGRPYEPYGRDPGEVEPVRDDTSLTLFYLIAQCSSLMMISVSVFSRRS